MFFIHHLYATILVSVEEQDGLMDSIVSGYKFVPEHGLRDDLAVQELQPDTVPDPKSEPESKTAT